MQLNLISLIIQGEFGLKDGKKQQLEMFLMMHF